MTPYKLTVDAETVQGLFTRDEALAGLVEQIVQQVLEAQVTDYLQAQPYDEEDLTSYYHMRNARSVQETFIRLGCLERVKSSCTRYVHRLGAMHTACAWFSRGETATCAWVCTGL